MKYVLEFLIALFPKDWVKPFFTVVLALGAFKGLDMYILSETREHARNQVNLAYSEAHASTTKRVDILEDKFNYFDRGVKDIKDKVDTQGSKIDRIDGKTDTIIRLLRR